MMRARITSLFLLLTCFLALFFTNAGFSQQVVGEEQQSAQGRKESTLQTEIEEEKLIASPKNIKEGTAIYAFLAWMWLAIFVLIYILRLKTKEVDRLYRLKFFSTKKE